MAPREKARLQLLAAALLFSTGGAAIKAVSFTSFQVAGLRSGIAALCLFLLSPSVRRGLSLRAAVVGVAYAATLVLFVLANKRTTAANTIFLQSTAPLYILLLGPLLLREPIDRASFFLLLALGLGMGLVFAGAGSGPAAVTAPAPFSGNVLAAFSGVAWALTLIGLRWLGRVTAPDRPTAAHAAVVLGNLWAFLFCLPFAWPAAGSTPPDLGDILLIGYLGCFQIALAYLFVTAAVRHLPALETSLLLLAEPALNPLWAWLWHGERPAGLSLCGGALILGSTTLKSLWDTRASRRP